MRRGQDIAGKEWWGNWESTYKEAEPSALCWPRGVGWWGWEGGSRGRGYMSKYCRFTEKAMVPHSSTLAWKIPGTAGPGGLPSMGSHRVGHNWNDLAGDIKQLNFIPSLIQRSEVQNQGVGKLEFPSEGLCRNLSLVSSNYWLLPAFLGFLFISLFVL